MKALEHLIDFEWDDIEEMPARAVLSAQATTVSDYFDDIGSPECLISDTNANKARAAFATVTNPEQTDAQKKLAVLTLKVPEAVKHLAGMLGQYDWDYVEQAKEIRGYVVANLLEISKHPDAKVKLSALKLLGSLTEVASFTERIEVIKKDATSDELSNRIREKLNLLLPKVIEVETLVPRAAPFEIKE